MRSIILAAAVSSVDLIMEYGISNGDTSEREAVVGPV